MGFLGTILSVFSRSKQAPKPVPNPDISPVLIAVVGCTGTGISTFIDAITGTRIKRASKGAELETKTLSICPVPVILEGKRPGQFPVVLVDTPGMDFAKGLDFKTMFNNLNKWKIDNYGEKSTFTGIIFMHRQVNQSLPKGEPSILHCGILKELCGENWKDKVVLVHNCQEETDDGTFYKTQEELLEAENGWRMGFWEYVTRADKIQDFFHFKDSQESAWKILWSLIKGTPNDLENTLKTMTRDPETVRLRIIRRAFQEVNSGTP